MLIILSSKGHVNADGQGQQLNECPGCLAHQWYVLAIIQVVMGRRLLGVFMTVYMPTILINIIGHSTNYFSETYFEATITVNLTASTTNHFDSQ